MNQVIDVYEVGPRDGFQNLKTYLPLEEKLQVIDEIIQAGVRHVQITSFVSPKAIPQMKDAKEVAAACLDRGFGQGFVALHKYLICHSVPVLSIFLR